MAPIVEVSHVSKIFQLRTIRASTLKETILVNLWKQGETRELTALDDVSFEVERGRALAIMGSNGSGKSTLLRILAGVTPATSGQVVIRGRTGSLIDLTAGLEPELNGIENIYYNASVLGLSRREVRRRLSDIIDFAELGYYIHSPVKYYSSGMLVRLAFSISVHLDPEILLVDEALSVGDTYFQAKSIDRMRRLRQRRNTTILLVTHNQELVEDMCDEVAWIERGRIKFCGPRTTGLDRLLIAHHEHVAQLPQLDFSIELMHLLTRGRFGNGDVVIQNVRFMDASGDQTCSFCSDQAFHVEIDYEAKKPVEGLMAGIGVERLDGLSCTIAYTPDDLFGGAVPHKGTIRAVLDPFDFLPGRYRISIALSPPGRPAEVYDLHLLMYMVRVTDGERASSTGAACRQEADFSVEPA